VTHGDVSFGPGLMPVDRYCWLCGSGFPAKLVLLKGTASAVPQKAGDSVRL
jgi:hypothetical protein